MYNRRDKLSFLCTGLMVVWGIAFNAYHLLDADSKADLLAFNLILAACCSFHIILDFEPYSKIIRNIKHWRTK